jgi:alcohol dehydrogenase (cytochrome c)
LPPIKATPILVNGVLYISTPDNLWAIDARSARQIWQYRYPARSVGTAGRAGPGLRGRQVGAGAAQAASQAVERARAAAARWRTIRDELHPRH